MENFAMMFVFPEARLGTIPPELARALITQNIHNHKIYICLAFTENGLLNFNIFIYMHIYLVFFMRQTQRFGTGDNLNAIISCA